MTWSTKFITDISDNWSQYFIDDVYLGTNTCQDDYLIEWKWPGIIAGCACK